MTDITKCINKKCKMKATCYRHTAPSGSFQSMAKFSPNRVTGKCDNYLKQPTNA